MYRVAERAHDVVCLGRAAVDLYGQQVGGRLEDMQTFAKYLGGSSANLAAGLAKLGVRSAMLTRVGDEHMGRFVREELERLGVDVSQVRTDPERLTGLVILGIGSADDIPHIFFRERCADMGLIAADVDASFIASARLLAITGTHLSTETTCGAVDAAIEHAAANGVAVALDIDYRPVLWGLGRQADGASRYAESESTTRVLQRYLPHCDLVIGTEEEIAIAGGSTDLVTALRSIRAVSDAAIVLKRGADGCIVFDGAKIDSLEAGIHCEGIPIEVFNTVGAGDAFLSGFLHAWLEGQPWESCGRRGNACGALVVARHGCTPAMPSRPELEHFLQRDPPPRQPRHDDALSHLHRTTTWHDDPRPLCILAFDHRSQFEQLAAEHGRPASSIGEFKVLIAEALLLARDDAQADVRHGAIIDHRYGEAAQRRLAGSSLWIGSPIEIPGSAPIDFEPHFAAGLAIAAWPSNHVVKCLVRYHPDDPPDLRHAQEESLRNLFADIVALERRLLLEVILPDAAGRSTPDALARALRRLYNLGIRPDWWKLGAQSADGWSALSDVISDCDPHCKGVVILGLGADAQTLDRGLQVAAPFPVCRGFAVGRSIFADAAAQWFAGEIGDDDARAGILARYAATIDTWCNASPT